MKTIDVFSAIASLAALPLFAAVSLPVSAQDADASVTCAAGTVLDIAQGGNPSAADSTPIETVTCANGLAETSTTTAEVGEVIVTAGTIDGESASLVTTELGDTKIVSGTVARRGRQCHHGELRKHQHHLRQYWR